TDNAKIIRKRSKPDKHEHGNGKSAQEPEVGKSQGQSMANVDCTLSEALDGYEINDVEGKHHELNGVEIRSKGSI
ncbi:hypothetical protein Tco_0732061, partial [Tanacetum coccineum]